MSRWKGKLQVLINYYKKEGKEEGMMQMLQCIYLRLLHLRISWNAKTHLSFLPNSTRSQSARNKDQSIII